VREPIRFRWRWRSGLLEGVLSGVLILVAIVAVWLALERAQAPLLSVLMSTVGAKVVGLGVATTWRYLGLAAFYSIVHTFLEEYYWRWFVFSRLRRRTGRALAIGLSSVGFMAHHTILMGVFAGWTSPYTYLFSLAVAVGGAYWAWLYERRGTIVAPWLSHLFVDVAIFAVGYALLRP
jgi:membrane protease YdiL (CAAX protease family)